MDFIFYRLSQVTPHLRLFDVWVEPVCLTGVLLFPSQPSSEDMDTESTSPPPAASQIPVAPPPVVPHMPEENTITNICASNIILDVPEMATRSRTGANKALAPAAAISAAQTITKIIIPKHMLQAGGQVVTVLPGGVRALQPTLLVSGAARQPPPLQQMQNAPPPPRLQQMAPAPPPLQAKPREGNATAGLSLSVSVTATPPPPLQIKIVPASLQGKEGLPIIVSAAAKAMSTTASVQVINSTHRTGHADEDVLPSEEVNYHSLSTGTTVCPQQ